MILARIAKEAGQHTVQKWNRRFVKASNQIESFPQIGSPVEDTQLLNLREMIVGPYRLVYQFDGIAAQIAFVQRAEQELSQQDPPS